MEQVPKEILKKILDLKSLHYSKGSIVRAIRKPAGSKEMAKQYVDFVYGDIKRIEKETPGIIKENGRTSFLIGLGFIVVGVVLTVLMSTVGALAGFSVAFPALILIGLGYILLSIFQLLKYIFKK
ncbi:MAG: hypothetical protein U0451_00085 [Candidatus Saccharimonadales bacterium]